MKREWWRIRLGFVLTVVALAGCTATLACLVTAPARIKSKVDRDRASLRAIATAVEAYYVDWSKYPETLDLLPKKMVFNPPAAFKIGMVSQLGPYIDSVPQSAFGKGEAPGYYVNPRRNWIAWTPGPAGDGNLSSASGFEEAFNALTDKVAVTPWLVNQMYDPTNGTFSKGLTIRWKR